MIELEWSAWQPHEDCWRGDRLPKLPGLYRIRRAGHDDDDTLDYIGQTGLTLRERQGMLRGIYGEHMPYRDPHTAGPALWALRHATGCIFEVSVMPYTGPSVMRLGLEAVAIAQYRQQHGRSPTIQFGRMPPGYQMSSSNNRRLVAAGKRSRGGVTSEADASHLPSIPPAGPLTGDPEGAGWGGHAWSAWVPAVEAVQSAIPSGANGLYRIRVPGQAGLVYVGQGLVRSRVGQHLRKVGRSAQGQSQGAVFREDMECSWVLNDAWHAHQRLELENDLIAAYMLWAGAPPPAQFMMHGGGGEWGRRERQERGGARRAVVEAAEYGRLRWTALSEALSTGAGHRQAGREQGRGRGCRRACGDARRGKCRSKTRSLCPCPGDVLRSAR